MHTSTAVLLYGKFSPGRWRNLPSDGRNADQRLCIFLTTSGHILKRSKPAAEPSRRLRHTSYPRRSKRFCLHKTAHNITNMARRRCRPQPFLDDPSDYPEFSLLVKRQGLHHAFKHGLHRHRYRADTCISSICYSPAPPSMPPGPSRKENRPLERCLRRWPPPTDIGWMLTGCCTIAVLFRIGQIMPGI